jgi:hypothetical protein
LRTFASIIGVTAYTTTVAATAAYVGNWGGHDQAFACAVLLLGMYFLLGTIATKTKDPSGG